MKIADIVSTVEDVGIRSTRTRINDWTIVTIPNGDLPARQIENYALRDRYRFNPAIAVEYDISNAKLREALSIIASILKGHVQVANSARANVVKFADNAIIIEGFSYIEVPDVDESVVVREDLLLTIHERLENARIPIARPARAFRCDANLELVMQSIMNRIHEVPESARSDAQVSRQPPKPGRRPEHNKV